MFKPRHPWDYLTLLVMGLGIAIRFYAGWTARLLPWRDSAVVMRMSRHMADGEPMPVFYYGQAYMGSLEAWIGSIAIRVFGDSPFAACLGTILPGCAVLGLTVWMGRKVAGVRGGFFTALGMMAMSGGALYLSVHPRGGYMVMLLAGLLTLHWGVGGLKAVGQPGLNWRLILCGFMGGLGWWTLQLVVMFFLPVVVLALPKWRGLLREKALPLSILAFGLGGLPWWIWNATHDWASLSMTQTVGKVGFGEGSRLFFERLILILGYGFAPKGIGWVQMAGCIGLFAVVVALLFHGFLQVRQPTHRRWQGVLPHALVVLAVFLVYASSYFATFDTPRYLLPLVPSMAILCGVGLTWLSERKRWGVLIALAAALWVQPWDTWRLGTWLDWMPENQQAVEDAQALGNLLTTTSEGDALGHPIEAWWAGYFSGGTAVVTDYPFDIYAPDNRRMEKNGIRAVVDNYLGVESFLHSTRAGFSKKQAGRFTVQTSFRAPDHHWDWLPATALAGVWENGSPLAPVLSDGNLDTRLLLSKTDRLKTLEWRFNGSPRLCGLVIPHPWDIPEDRITLTAVLPDGGEVVLMTGAPRFDYFWSGHRMLRGGEGTYRMMRFTPPALGVDAIRLQLRVPADLPIEARELSEVMWMVGKQSDSVTVEEASLLTLLTGLEGGTVLAPRWMRTVLSDGSESIDLRLPSCWNREVNELSDEDEVHPAYLPVEGPLRLIVHERDLPRTEGLLTDSGFKFTEGNKVGPWIAVDCHNPELGAQLPLYWTEFGVMGATGKRFKRFERAIAYLKASQSAEPDQASRLKQLAQDVAPDMVGLQEPSAPAIPVPAVFAEGLTLRGVDWEWDASNHLLTMDWHWIVPAEFPLRRWSLFVHVQQEGETLFQDDHNPGHEVLPWVAEPAPVDRHVTISRSIKVPEGVSGALDIKAGWLDPGTGDRIRVRSDAKVDKGTVRFQGVALQTE